jgi:glycosyltransferase involved in cell wall biosynthesis
MLEAMAVGVPVLTRNIGQVPELSNGKNMVVRKGEVDDIEDLKTELKDLVEGSKAKDIRENAWDTVKTCGDVRRAREYEQLWWSILNKKSLVSVIVPTFNRLEVLQQVITALMEPENMNNYGGVY